MFENLFLLLYVTCFFQVKKITLHEDFEIYYKGDDIAVFVLEVAVAYSEHVRPLCLPQIDEHLPPSAICYTGGWGYMNQTRQLLLLIFVDNSLYREWAHCHSSFLLSRLHWSFPYIERKFSEFSEFREPDKSLKYELGSLMIIFVTRVLLVVW